MASQAELDSLAVRTVTLLKQHRQTLVTAESCTAGLISATLSRVPGVSGFFAGSFVVYQIASKIRWLQLDPALVREDTVVSRDVAVAMVLAALQQTPHATIALSVTGHLGPDAPEHLDGTAWTAFARHSGSPVDTTPVLSRHLLLHPQSVRSLDVSAHYAGQPAASADAAFHSSSVYPPSSAMTDVQSNPSNSPSALLIRHQRQSSAAAQCLAYLIEQLTSGG